MVEEDDEEKDLSDSDEDELSETQRQRLKVKQLRKERSQLLRVLPQFDRILYELDEKQALFNNLTKICKSSMFLTNAQWVVLDSVLEFSTQISTVHFCS